MTLHTGFSAGFLLSFAFAFPAVAQDEGRALSHACTSCHGIEGRGSTQIPALAGRSASELLALRGYDDAQLEALAAYFAQVAP